MIWLSMLAAVVILAALLYLTWLDPRPDWVDPNPSCIRDVEKAIASAREAFDSERRG